MCVDAQATNAREEQLGKIAAVPLMWGLVTAVLVLLYLLLVVLACWSIPVANVISGIYIFGYCLDDTIQLVVQAFTFVSAIWSMWTLCMKQTQEQHMFGVAKALNYYSYNLIAVGYLEMKKPLDLGVMELHDRCDAQVPC